MTASQKPIVNAFGLEGRLMTTEIEEIVGAMMRKAARKAGHVPRLPKDMDKKTGPSNDVAGPTIEMMRRIAEDYGTLQDIKDATGFSYDSAKALLSRHGITLKTRDEIDAKRHSEHGEQIAGMIAKGMTTAEIAARLGVGVRYVQRISKRVAK